MSAIWTAVKDQLPEDDQRVLGFIPGNKVFLPGKDLQFETREVVVLRFCKDFYAKNEEKRIKHGLHFWAGEETATTSLPTSRIGARCLKAPLANNENATDPRLTDLLAIVGVGPSHGVRIHPIGQVMVANAVDVHAPIPWF